MYSLILMTAMTSAPAGPEFNGYFRDLFRGRSNGCSGSSCSGGVFHGRIIALFSFGGGDCYGSCAGSGRACYGSSCSGSCSGSVANASSCRGSQAFSCSGSQSYSCMGSQAYSCTGGPSYSCSGGMADSYAGCFGSGAGGMMTFPQGGMMTLPQGNLPPGGYTIPNTNLPMGDGVPYAQPGPAPVIDDPRFFRPSNYLQPGVPGVRGTVVVRLPADAKLYAEGRLLTLTGAERTFVTPELPAGQSYAYTFKVEYDRQGVTLSETKKVGVTPGKTSTAEFVDVLLAKTTGAKPTDIATEPPPPAPPRTSTVPAAVPNPDGPARARILVKLPPGAKLFIDDKAKDGTGDVREFTTPPLAHGKEYAYTMKVQVMKNGYPEEVIEKVPFRAGEIVNRDFAAVLVETNGQRAGR